MFLELFQDLPPLTAEERQASALEIVRILRSPVYRGAIKRCEAKAAHHAVFAPTEEARQRARACCYALQDIEQELLAAVDDQPLTTSSGIDSHSQES